MTFACKIEPLGFLYSHALLIPLNLTFACKTEPLGSLYSHALLIPLKLFMSKYQVVHEQKFKDLLSNNGQVSVERRVLESVESEAMRGLGSIPTGKNILSLDFMSCSKLSDANIGIIANFI